MPTVESESRNDDVTLCPQKCNHINIPSLPPTTYEWHNELIENSPKRIPFISCKHVVNQIISYKELIIIKEQE